MADELARLGRAVAVEDRGGEALAVEHRLEVVGHAAVDGDVRHRTALDGHDRVDGDPGAADQRAPGLDDQLRVRVQVRRERRDGRRGVVGDRRHGVLRRVGDPQPAAEVVDREAPERGQRRRGAAEPVEVEQLGADVHVQADQLEPRRGRDPVEQPRGVGERDAELGLRAAGVHRRVREPGHARVHAHQDALAGGRQAREPVDVVGAVDDDQADPGLQGGDEVGVALRVAVQQHVRGVEPRRQGDRQLAGRGDVAAQPLLREDPHDGSARQRLGGEVHVGRGVARRERGQVLARGRAQAVLVDDEDRGPVLRGDVGERAAADGQAPVGQAPRRPREDAGEAHTEMSRRRIRAAPAAANTSA